MSVRIYLVAIASLKGSNLGTAARIVYTEDETRAIGMATELAYKQWPREDGRSYIIGELEDVTDKIRAILQEIDAK